MARKTLSVTPLPAFPMVPDPNAADDPNVTPCWKCTALCCRYYALQLDVPEDAEDFDSLRWYMIHGRNTWIWVDEGDWYLQVDEACRYLGPRNECTIYETRPQICRDYGLPEKRESPGDPLCDYFAQDASHDIEFRTPDELLEYAAKFLAKREAQRKKRSAAARRAWLARKRGQEPAKKVKAAKATSKRAKGAGRARV